MIRYLTSGESHGPQLDVIIDGFPANFPLDIERINKDLALRQTRLGSGARQAIETDRVIVNAGIMNGLTTGSPLSFTIKNKNHKDWKGKKIKAFTIPRPGHADRAGAFKYKLDDLRKVLERASARETATRVVLGSCCMQLLESLGISVYTEVKDLGPKSLYGLLDREKVAKTKKFKETIGGTLTTTIDKVPAGLGSFTQADRRLDARLSAAILSIPAIKGIEFGSGFGLANMFGTEAQDHLGGITGGMSTGEDITFNCVMKPIPTTLTPQNTIDLFSKKLCKTTYERSDIAPILRTPIIISSMAAYVILNELIETFGGDTFSELEERIAKKRLYHFDGITNLEKEFWK